MNRDEVLSLQYTASKNLVSCHLTPDELAELCRAWLALDAAPEGEVGYLCADDAGAECHVYRRETFPADMMDQRVRIVATPASGGPRDG
jgi:hypothetical protein